MAKNIKISSDIKVAVVGDIHEHKDQFDLLLKAIQPSEKMFLVSVGDIYDKGFGINVAEEIVDIFINMNEKGYGFVVRGNHELKHIRRNKNNINISKQLTWMGKQPLSISFEFDNGTRLTIMHAGVKPKHVWQDLNYDLEVAYIRDLDESGNMIKLDWIEENGKKTLKPRTPNGVPWHKSYDGRFGYIIAGHDPQRDGVAKFYNYSCNIDSAVYQTGILTCQVFSSSGREELMTFSGPAGHPKGLEGDL